MAWAWLAGAFMAGGCAAQAPVVAPPGGMAPPPGGMAPPQGPPPAAGPQYLHADAAALLALIGPPPAAGSEAQQRDLAGVLAAQAAARGTPRREQAIADAQGSCGRFADALGGEVPQPVLSFLDRAAWQAAGYVGEAKRVHARPRPYVGEPRVERLADVADRGRDNDRTSYPSGHSALGTACGLLLSMMVPEHGAALYERGLAYGESRLVVGAHFPRDVLAGRIAATMAVANMQQDAAFQRDYAQARGELRAALKLAE